LLRIALEIFRIYLKKLHRITLYCTCEPSINGKQSNASFFLHENCLYHVCHNFVPGIPELTYVLILYTNNFLILTLLTAYPLTLLTLVSTFGILYIQGDLRGIMSPTE
jgi:hypothetical protein